MRGSARTASQYSGGISDSGPAGPVAEGRAVAVHFSICFWDGMRQLAGRSLMAQLEHNKNKRARGGEKNIRFVLAQAVGTTSYRSS